MIALFDKHPELITRLKRLELGTFPTPIDHLDRPFHNIYIKRDDVCSQVKGGNKTRKLEFLLADTDFIKRQHIVTVGGFGSNHCVATAEFCKILNLPCTLILYEQPDSECVQKALERMKNTGAEMRMIHYTDNEDISSLIIRMVKEREAYFIPSGGTSVHGNTGIINAVFELWQQINDELMPEPDYIYCASGSGGMVAGLALGISYLGLKTQVIGVDIVGSHDTLHKHIDEQGVRRLALKTHRFLQNSCGLMYNLPVTLPYRITEEYCGMGYGHPTAEGKDACRIFEHTGGMLLDDVYTAKAAAAVLSAASNQNKTFLFWHSNG